MRYLLRRDTRAARLAILYLRVRAIERGDDVAELYLTLHYSFWAAALCLPGNTMSHAAAWSVLRELTGGDDGLAAVCALLAALLLPGMLRLWPVWLHRTALLATVSVSFGIAIGFFLGYPFSLGPYDLLLCSLLAWFAYLHVDRDQP